MNTTYQPTPEETLRSLRQLRDRLYAEDVTATMAAKSVEERAVFKEQRQQLTGAVAQLELARLSTIRQQLEELGGELVVALDGLTKDLQGLEKTARIAQGLGSVLSTLTRIAPVA